jgi:2-amino-4-hydroxy-6-hydroxymethyldihydropteridine diphosphokinase
VAGSEDNGQWVRAFIGLGSNAGDRLGFVQQAMQLLKDHPHIEVVECSSLYECEPVGHDYVEWFVNAVAAIETDLPPQDLLKVCKEIEERLVSLAGEAAGAEVCRLPKGAPGKTKIIDLDILFFGDTELKAGRLVVPHPLLAQRAYALVPLLEIAPDLMHPILGKSITEMHEDLNAPEQVVLYGTRENCDLI